MTAATGRIYGPKPFAGVIPEEYVYPLAAGVTPYRNWLMGIVPTTGNGVAQAAGVTNLISAGFSDRDDLSAAVAAGQQYFGGRQTFVSGFVNATTGADPILATSIAVAAYAVDNQTVGLLSNLSGTNRSLAGLAFGLDPDGVNGSPVPIIWVGTIAWLLARATTVMDAFCRASLSIADAAANTAIAERAMNNFAAHGKLTGVTFTGAAIAADNTDYITVTISKRDGAGGGATSLATYDSRAANNGAVTAFVPAAFTLTATVADLDILETDVLTITTVKGASGKTITGAVRANIKVG